MATFINEESLINQNAFILEDKLNSQYTKFLERPPSFVTYFSINCVESTVDEGFLNIEKLIGENSPLKFNKIEKLPVYGLDTINLDLDEEEEGLDTNYDGELIILPNTVIPLQNDFFIVNHISQPVIFMVTEVKYDTIKSNGYYKISYTLKDIAPEKIISINDQTVEKYQCVFKNIGTEDKCLIRSEHIEQMDLIQQKFDELTDRYFSLFYDEDLNSLLFSDIICVMYDKFVTHFLMSNKVFQNPTDYKSITLTNEDYSNTFLIQYDKSVYKAIETRNIEKIKPRIQFMYTPIQYGESVFLTRYIQDIMSIKFLQSDNTLVPYKEYIDETLLQNILDNNIVDDNDNLINISEKTSRMIYVYNIIVNYFNENNTDVFLTNLQKLDICNIDYSLDSFILVPIILFISNNVYNMYTQK